jgi:hypothetical protein
MVSKCLNSCCSATFRYLGKGKLYCVDFADLGRRNALAGRKTVTSIRSKAWPVEYFWLCERCAATMAIEFTDAGELQLVPMEVTALCAAAVAASQKYSAQSTRTSPNHSGGADGEFGEVAERDHPGEATGQPGEFIRRAG